jgi:bacterioferritin (cytochrome b1)
MSDEDVIGLLNDLLELESCSLVARLGEAYPFMGRSAAEHGAVFQQMVEQEADHQRRLVGAIEALDGVPRPARGDTLSAGLHYLNLEYLLPQIVEEKQRLIAAYRRSADEIPTDGPAAAVVADILARHQAHLERLQQMTQRPA